MVFHWSLSDSQSFHVPRTRLRILAVLSNAVVWIVSTRPPTSKSSRLFNNPLVIVPYAPITIGTIVTFMFHSFFNSLARLRYLSFFSHSFRFILWSAETLDAYSTWYSQAVTHPSTDQARRCLTSVIGREPVLSLILGWELLHRLWYYLPTPPLAQDMTQGQFLSGV